MRECLLAGEWFRLEDIAGAFGRLRFFPGLIAYQMLRLSISVDSADFSSKLRIFRNIMDSRQQLFTLDQMTGLAPSFYFQQLVVEAALA